MKELPDIQELFSKAFTEYDGLARRHWIYIVVAAFAILFVAMVFFFKRALGG